MNLNLDDWKEFKLGNLFLKPYKAKAFNKDELEESEKVEGSIRYITRTGENNGCEMLVKRESISVKAIEKGNAISIGDTTATCFYQPEDFIAGDHIVVIRAEWLNAYNALFILTLLNKEQYKYSYGRAFLMDRIAETVMKLPVQYNEDGTIFVDSSRKYSNEGYVPDWEFMENYIKTLHHKSLITKNESGKVPKLNVNDWKEFRIGAIFLVSTTKMSVKDDLTEGDIPFISRTAENNGCDGYVEVDVDKISKGNCLTIGAEGIYCFYQPEDFATGNKIYTLRNTNLTSFSSLFIATILNKDDYKYSYGRARIKGKLEEEIIKLPIKYNLDGTPFIDDAHTYSKEGYIPDWQYMEDYIKSLPYGDRL